MRKRTIRSSASTRRAWQRCHARSAGIFAGAAMLGFLLTHADDARACGACLARPNETTVVTDHRMAFSISTQQTVLWDQIRYSGDPSEFAWVLPVRQGARIELSRDEWIAALDAATQPVVIAPYQAPASSGGSGCGGSTNDSAAFAPGSGAGQVQVVHQEVVGPYETATIRSTSATALQDWLTSHGYDVPASIEPTIAAYTSEGFDFIALRLRPGQGTRAMKPVRVVSPGADLSMPLRMIAGGAGESVALTLYVIGEGRYHPVNFPDVTFDESSLKWDSGQNRSNYQELSEQAMAQGDRNGWLTEFAGPPSLYQSTYVNGRLVPALPDLYKASCEGDAGQPSYPLFDAAGAPRDVDAAGDAESDAGTDADADADADAGSNDVDASGPLCAAVCCDFDDLDVAFRGLHESSIWITRLRANLPKTALAADLRLGATLEQRSVSNVHYANADTVSAGGGGCNAAPGDRGSWLTIGGALVGLAAILRRRRV